MKVERVTALRNGDDSVRSDGIDVGALGVRSTE